MNVRTLTALTLIGLSPAIAAEQMPAKVSNLASGPVLADAKGMTLYTFDKDAEGKSACNGDCAAAWPPLMATEGETAMGDWTIIKRDDGGKQWAYKAKPLYTWIKDKQPGDVTGDGFKDVWHVAKP